MPKPILEDQLLDRALQRGLISPADLAAPVPSLRAGAAATKFGPRLDALIAQGRLTEGTVARLQDELANPILGQITAPPAGRITQTDSISDDTQASARPIAETMPGPLPAQTTALAHTMDSAAADLAPSVSISVSAFPVQNWTKYEFLEVLGRGGMGAVYKGRDRRLGRIVALKFIHGDDPGQIQRFMQEARAQARLEHPNICKVLEVGTVDNRPYIAMQFVDGLPFDQAARAMTLVEKVRVMRDAARAMHEAHEQGVIHRDLKPSKLCSVENSAMFVRASSRFWRTVGTPFWGAAELRGFVEDSDVHCNLRGFAIAREDDEKDSDFCLVRHSVRLSGDAGGRFAWTAALGPDAAGEAPGR